MPVRIPYTWEEDETSVIVDAQLPNAKKENVDVYGMAHNAAVMFVMLC